MVNGDSTLEVEWRETCVALRGREIGIALALMIEESTARFGYDRTQAHVRNTLAYCRQREKAIAGLLDDEPGAT